MITSSRQTDPPELRDGRRPIPFSQIIPGDEQVPEDIYSTTGQTLTFIYNPRKRLVQ